MHDSMIYWEWVASADNWSGGVSRLGPSDPWLYTGTYRHHFHPFIAEPLFLLFHLSQASSFEPSLFLSELG